jgi:hypothetical protein
MPLQRVSAAMGHTDSRFTGRTYIKVRKDLDEVNLELARQISDRQVERFGRYGLELRATHIPANGRPRITDHARRIEREPEDAPIGAVINGAIASDPVPGDATTGPAAPIVTLGALRTAQRTRIHELHDQGMQLEDIGRTLELTDDTVRHWLEMRGVEVVVGRSDVPKRVWRVLEERARVLAEPGTRTALEIAREVGVFVLTVRHWGRSNPDFSQGIGAIGGVAVGTDAGDTVEGFWCEGAGGGGFWPCDGGPRRGPRRYAGMIRRRRGANTDTPGDTRSGTGRPRPWRP